MAAAEHAVDYCACGALTVNGVCLARSSCPALPVEDLSWRPRQVVVRSESDTTPVERNVAVLRVPDDLPERDREVIEVIAFQTSVRLAEGATTGFAFTIAAGRDWLRDRLRLVSGIAVSRWTAARTLRRLVRLDVLDRVGQLPPWADWNEPDPERVGKSGAYLYRLVVDDDALRLEAFTPSPSTCSLLGAERKERRLAGALKWAIDNAYEGCRNAIGHWLACRSHEAGADEAETLDQMRSYVREVGRGTYTEREAERTVRSLYRRKARAA